ncbi:hypothetical protein [Bradyrhizobium sp. Tv2a-2]|uniref:hypothetical protein n=1 Tax=Bradyrhizobium sp. Tv2a-2 TaxID=113395 RepID=UPI0003FF45BE|nr:hypothetical protein [Bradyrhizobium sp. Tv2a-2]
MSEQSTFFNAVGWIGTATGGAFNVLDPKVEDVRLNDIAHALSRQCRYGGHCRRFYSVAEHSVHVAHNVAGPNRVKLASLLHDASEAFLVDIPRPIKNAMPEYRAIEDHLMRVIYTRFGLDGLWPLPPEIVDIDVRILHDECEQNVAKPAVPWGFPGDPVGVTLRYWSPEVAASWFLSEFYRYGGND